ncbi:hypothetical protein ACJX0J_008511, partial [Zea mays]
FIFLFDLSCSCVVLYSANAIYIHSQNSQYKGDFINTHITNSSQEPYGLYLEPILK